MSSKPPSQRMRVRELLPTLHLGFHAPGPTNSLADVPGVLTHFTTINQPAAPPAHDRVNTGITTILPRRDWLRRGVYASVFAFNGSGEATGSHWLAETGILNSPVVLTNSWAVGECYQGVYRYAAKRAAAAQGKRPEDASTLCDVFLLPVVAETYDGMLNDVTAFPLAPQMVVEGIERARAGPVEEGNRGGGTGMCCHGFKGGNGSASRVVRALRPSAERGEDEDVTYTVAAFCQCNYGAKRDLRIGGVPVGRLLMEQDEKARGAPPEGESNAAATRWGKPVDVGGPESGASAEASADASAGASEKSSIIAVIATDAPLSPSQLQRLAKRATVGLARVGGWGGNYSGDIFIAFSTGSDVPFLQANVKVPTVADASLVGADADSGRPGGFVQENSINALFECAADAVEESIYNALCMAEDMEGPAGRKMAALDLERVKGIMERYL